jgi:hypothetical protein
MSDLLLLLGAISVLSVYICNIRLISVLSVYICNIRLISVLRAQLCYIRVSSVLRVYLWHLTLQVTGVSVSGGRKVSSCPIFDMMVFRQPADQH